jgi:hypothetical protein
MQGMCSAYMGGVAERYQLAVMAQCTLIDDKPVIMEELEDLWMNDYTLISTMAAINFPITQTA